ncbi:protein kinase [Micromonospora sp. NPDC000207]|uniref:serine/threonine-protein kinase n=1 Tax=Micromonospora sp. NPDC000207 TaxID=3154246 RepID=UPI003320821D
MQQALIAGRYRLLNLVGTGGMGRVWRARDEMLHRDVAVKEIVPPAWLGESERDEIRHRTLREARTAARLDHPNVVRVYDVLTHRGGQWLVMEYVPSRSVQQIVTAEGPLPPRRVARIGLAVLAALRAAHAAGVLHRDVKPHNVLVAEDGRVVLTDFGLATFVGGDAAMTGPGMVLGSPQFVAPERAREGIADARTDLWSLGATLFAAVEGVSPYARGSAMATLSALATEPPAPARRAGPLRPVLTGLLQRDPARRLDPDEVERLLRQVASGVADAPVHRTVTTGGRPWVRATSARGRPVGVLVAAGAAVVLVAVAGVLVSTGGGDDPGPVGGTATPVDRRAAFACAGSPPVAARPVPSVPPPQEEPGLVPGWTWHLDPSGFRIAAPVGWQRWTDAAAVCFREPNGSRLLSVAAGAAPTDPVRHWRAEEKRITGAGSLPGYERVDISAIDLYQGGAVWECRWRDGAGDPVHAARLLVRTSPGRAYTLTWQTGEFDWQVNATYFLMVRQSFRPAPPV